GPVRSAPGRHGRCRLAGRPALPPAGQPRDPAAPRRSGDGRCDDHRLLAPHAGSEAGSPPRAGGGPGSDRRLRDRLADPQRPLDLAHPPGRESYGTTRASAVAARLMDRYYVAVAGIALISPVLDFGTLRFTAGNDRPYVHYLPTYAAIAHAHGKHSGRLLQDVVDEAEAFAEQEYPGLLAAGLR